MVLADMKMNIFPKIYVDPLKLRVKVPFDYSEYLDTVAKFAPLKDTVKFYYALFSESGFEDKLIEEAENLSNLLLYDLKKIVNYK